MSYGIGIPGHQSGKTSVTRDEFKAEAEKVIQDYHAYDGQPIEERVRAHMQAGVEAAGKLLSKAPAGETVVGPDFTVIEGERFVVTINGHVSSGNDSPDWITVGVRAE